MKQIISLFSLLVVLVLLMNCNKSTPSPTLPNVKSNPEPANPYTEQGYIMTNLKKYDEAQYHILIKPSN
jgi:hypothetical protein